MTILVANDAELKAALAAAVGGEVITLAPGVYPAFRSTRPLAYGAPVTLKAAERHAVTFAGLDLQRWAGVHVEGVRIESEASPVVNLSSARNIALRDCRVSGTDPNRNPWDDGNTGLHVRSATGITVHGCEFYDLRSAIYCQRSTNVTIEECRLWGLREGINIAACSFLVLKRNEISDFWPNYGKSEHPDAIQFWTNGETRGSEDVLIEGNRCLQSGRKPVHGIFARSEVVGLRHRRWVVRDNLYYGSAKHGVSLSEVETVTIERNIVLPSTHAGSKYARGQDGGETSSALMPCIYTSNTTTGLARNNAAPFFQFGKGTVDGGGNIKGWPVGGA